MKKQGGVPYFGLVNLREDELGVASDLGKPQREFFHLLVSAIRNQDSKSLDVRPAAAAPARVSAAPPPVASGLPRVPVRRRATRATCGSRWRTAS